MTQVSQLLLDKDRLRKRTQLKRSKFQVIGKKVRNLNQPQFTLYQSGNDNEDYDEQIFDDTDFYQTLLKEFIESNSTDRKHCVMLFID
jgi:protein AATF/BFR2